MTPNVEVEFDIGVVWDRKLWWYLKGKDADHFGPVLVGEANVQMTFGGLIQSTMVDPKIWEETKYC